MFFVTRCDKRTYLSFVICRACIETKVTMKCFIAPNLSSIFFISVLILIHEYSLSIVSE